METIRHNLRCMLLTLVAGIAGTDNILAQPVVAAKDGVGTQVTLPGSSPDQFDIGGGTQAGANLFHSLEKFGLSQGQIANFLSNPNIQNILSRVVGGDASVIDGLIQVTGGDSNLFLMNPAGILFGPNASLNVPGSFIATTADGIQIDEQWFKAIGSNDYEKLVGEPNGYAFVTDEPGAIVNTGDLDVPQGERIALVGGTVVNTGKLTAPGGDVTIAAVEGEQLVRVSQEGSVLSLDLPVDAKAALTEQTQPLKPASLPQLLTGGELEHAAGVVVEDGVVRLTASKTVIPDEPGVAIASGTLDASNIEAPVSDTQAEGGDITVLGDKVGVIAADIDASGKTGGGTVLIGGNYKGQGPEPNAQRTFVSNDSDIRADAIQKGDGGRVIVWSDEATDFHGNISARGGTEAGDGGFVEVSGKENLAFRGNVDVTANSGHTGTLLLDPDTIRITDTALGTGTLEGNFPLNMQGEIGIFSDVPNDGDNTISAAQLETFDSSANIVLEANDGITVNDIADDVLDLKFASGSITFRANANNDSTGDFIMNSGDTIRTQGGAVEISGTSLTVGKIMGGAITLEATEGDINTGKLDTNGAVILFSSTGQIRTEDIETLGSDVKISGAEITTGSITTILDSFGSVTLTAKTGDVVVDTITAGSGGIDVTAARLFRAEGSFPVSRDSNVSLGVDPELDAFVENLDDQTRQQVIHNGKVTVFFINLPVSLRVNNDSLIRILHGGQSLNSDIPNITIQGNENLPGVQFVVGPQTSGTLMIVGDEIVRSGFSPLSTPSDQFPADMSGTVGAIATLDVNGILTTSFQNRPFQSPLAESDGSQSSDPGGVSAIALAAQTLELEGNTSSEEECHPSDPECGAAEAKLLDVSGVQQSPEPK